MTEINGYLLSTEEEKACLDLVKELRKRKTYVINFSGDIRVKAKNPQDANHLFWKWVEEMQDKTAGDWSGIATQTPFFENEGIEEE